MSKSDGGSSDYYKFVIPAGTLRISDGPAEGMPVNMDVVVEVDNVIKYMLHNDWHKGNIFKALVRVGRKKGIDEPYDLNKIGWFLGQMAQAAQCSLAEPTPEASDGIATPTDLTQVYTEHFQADPVYAAILKDIKGN